MTTILIERQKGKTLLWCSSELMAEFGPHTNPASKPLELARLIEKALTLCHVPCEIEFGEELEELRELL